MKFKILSILLFVIFALDKNACSTTYYISSSIGNDLNSGTQIISPLKTLNRLNNQTIVAGDSILLKCGDVFFGTIILKTSGNISSPIYFGKYSNGALPVISGFKKLINWTNIGNIYSTNDSNFVRSIWLNNKWMQLARFPNKGFLNVLSIGLNNAIYAPYLNQVNNYWNNATVVIRTDGFQYKMANVDTFNQGFLYFSSPLSSVVPFYNGFFLENYLAALDTSNEWYYDTLSNQVLIIPPTSTDIISADVEASILDFGFVCDSVVNYVVIDSLCFMGQSVDAIRFSNVTGEIKIMNCNFEKIKQHAINFSQVANSNLIFKNIIQDCGGDAVIGYFFNQTKIQNNEIHRTGMKVGFGMNDVYIVYAINVSVGIFNTVSDNFIDSTAYSGINLYGYLNKIERNFINNSMITLEGGGGILLSGSISNKNLIRDNFILNTKHDISGTGILSPISAGIFMSYFCQQDTIIHNTIVNADSYGIYFGPFNSDHIVGNNTLYNNQDGQLFIADGDPINSTSNIQIHHNILYSLNDKQKSIQLTGMNSSFLPFKADSNYYCNPYDYFPIYQKSVLDTVVSEKIFSLPSWQKATLQDSNSHVSNVEWQNYYVTDTTGSDLITNGNFTNNYDGWNTEPSGNNSLLLDNLTMMNDGCIKFEITDTIPYDYAKTVSNDFALQINQFYQMSFSTAGFKNGILHADITEQISPYGGIGVNKYFPIETFRKDFNYFFQTSTYGNPLGLNFELHKSDSLVYFDNIYLFPVSVFKHDSSRMSVLLMNYSPNTISVPLGTDSVFRDLDGNMVTGSYTLNPYSSYVLVLNSPLNLVSLKEIPKQNSIIVFPNPVQSSKGKISIQLPDENMYDFEVCDLTGRKFQFGKFSGSTINTFSMKNASAGIYILSVHSAIKLWQQKIVVVN